MYGDRYVQNNFAEIKTEAPENVGKLSSDRNNNIQGDMPYTGSLYTGLTVLSIPAYGSCTTPIARLF